MARGKKGVDGIDRVVDLFPKHSHKMIERLLVRAAEREAKQAGRGVKAALRNAMGGSGGGRRGTGGLAAELAKALRQRGDVGGGKPSIRQTSPETGGRPFHFAHSVVSKGDAGPAGSGRDGKRAKGPSGTRGGVVGNGRAAAHMRYIEREIAVETTYGQGLDVGGERAAESGRERGEGAEREVGRSDDGKTHATSAGAGQGYIENPIKLANGERIVFSFGTIGDTFDERVRFWEALEEAEAHPSARVQHRLIVELPHEASPQARFDMVKAFTQRFEADGIPYWAALHAPGKDNDSRNTHAHIVYSERPARRMVDPADPTGPEKWDFSITSTYTTSSRNKVTCRPHRQNKSRTYTARDFIRTIRKEFGDTVNAVLTRDDVRDRQGRPVLYDARSYRDMGVDAVPMRSIDRIVADRVKGGKATVLDAGYTRRMIATELREAYAKRQRDVMELVALDGALRDAVEGRRPTAKRKGLPKDMRVSPWANPGRAVLAKAAEGIMQARHAALQVEVMERATTASLNRVLAATEPAVVDAASRTKDPVKRAEAPSSEGARLLHAAARDEAEETRAAAATARKTAAYKVGRAVNEWRSLVGAAPTEIAPAIKRVLEDDGPQNAVEPGQDVRRSPGGDASRATSRSKGEVEAGPGGRDGSGPGRTRSLKDALWIAMPTTTEDLEAASRSVSGWIASIAEVEGYDERMRMLDALVTGLKDGVRKRQGRASVDGEEAEGRTEPAPTVAGATTVAMPVVEVPMAPERSREKDDGIDETVPEVARTEAVEARRGAEPPEDDPLERHPDDARRRKRREDEIERQKRMRQAVLARKNRGRGR